MVADLLLFSEVDIFILMVEKQLRLRLVFLIIRIEAATVAADFD